MTKLVLIKPTNEPAAEESSYAPRPHDLRSKRLGLLDNSKNRAGQFLDMVAAILDERYRFSNIVRHRKPAASKPAAREVIEDWTRTCDIAISGVGD